MAHVKELEQKKARVLHEQFGHDVELMFEIAPRDRNDNDQAVRCGSTMSQAQYDAIAYARQSPYIKRILIYTTLWYLKESGGVRGGGSIYQSPDGPLGDELRKVCAIVKPDTIICDGFGNPNPLTGRDHSNMGLRWRDMFKGIGVEFGVEGMACSKIEMGTTDVFVPNMSEIGDGELFWDLPMNGSPYTTVETFLKNADEQGYGEQWNAARVRNPNVIIWWMGQFSQTSESRLIALRQRLGPKSRVAARVGMPMDVLARVNEAVV
jgi:hypothetical protein